MHFCQNTQFQDQVKAASQVSLAVCQLLELPLCTVTGTSTHAPFHHIHWLPQRMRWLPLHWLLLPVIHEGHRQSGLEPCILSCFASSPHSTLDWLTNISSKIACKAPNFEGYDSSIPIRNQIQYFWYCRIVVISVVSICFDIRYHFKIMNLIRFEFGAMISMRLRYVFELVWVCLGFGSAIVWDVNFDLVLI